MTLLFSSERFLDHKTGEHPEHPGRLRTALDSLRGSAIWSKMEHRSPVPADLDAIHQVHEPGYLGQLREFCRDGGGRIETDTVTSSDSFEVARLASGGAIAATDSVLTGEDKNAFCLARPPGHHALPDGPMGFCLFNHIAVAAESAIRKHGLSRVLVVDFDVHHGNGTQDSFYDREEVGFFSVHRFPFYPGSGSESETGTGAGLGTTRNLPLAFGTSPDHFLKSVERELVEFASQIRPELILVSAGFDAHHADPVGNLGLDQEHFAALSNMVCQLASEHCSGKLVSLLEGGYNPDRLAESIEIHLTTLDQFSSSPGASSSESS